MFQTDVGVHGLGYTHSYAEVIGERFDKPSSAFCGSPRCLHDRGAVIYSVKGLGRGVMRSGKRNARDCPSCCGVLFYSHDYYLLKDKRLSHVVEEIDKRERVLRGARA